jgi:hypothetical protein
MPKDVTMDNISELASLLGVTVTSNGTSLHLDTAKDAPRQLHGNYSHDEGGLYAAYSDLGRYAVTLGLYAHFNAANR